MESLWDSLYRDAEFEPSPAWHADVLKERRAELEQGRHSPWHEVKERLQTLTKQDH